MLTNDYYTNRNSIKIKQKSDDDNNTDADMITVSNFSTYLVKELSETNIIYSFSEGFYDLYFLLIYWRNLVDVAAVFYYWLTQRYWKKKHELHQSFSLIWDIKYYIYFKKTSTRSIYSYRASHVLVMFIISIPMGNVYIVDMRISLIVASLQY